MHPQNSGLTELKVGSLALDPEFDSETLEYSAETTNASNKITAVAANEGATITILNGTTPVDNEGSAVWEEGDNTLTVKVSFGGTDITYTVTVTYSTED